MCLLTRPGGVSKIFMRASSASRWWAFITAASVPGIAGWNEESASRTFMPSRLPRTCSERGEEAPLRAAAWRYIRESQSLDLNCSSPRPGGCAPPPGGSPAASQTQTPFFFFNSFFVYWILRSDRDRSRGSNSLTCRRKPPGRTCDSTRSLLSLGMPRHSPQQMMHGTHGDRQIGAFVVAPGAALPYSMPASWERRFRCVGKAHFFTLRSAAFCSGCCSTTLGRAERLTTGGGT